jgi:hypothetical protein
VRSRCWPRRGALPDRGVAGLRKRQPLASHASISRIRVRVHPCPFVQLALVGGDTAVLARALFFSLWRSLLPPSEAKQQKRERERESRRNGFGARREGERRTLPSSWETCVPVTAGFGLKECCAPCARNAGPRRKDGTRRSERAREAHSRRDVYVSLHWLTPCACLFVRSSLQLSLSFLPPLLFPIAPQQPPPLHRRRD